MSTFIIRNPETPVDRAAFRERCEQGLKERYGEPAPQDARERLEYELAVIERHGLAGAFHVASEFAAEARRQGVYVAPCPDPARCSLTACALRFSDIDPRAYGLLFERYLSPESDRETSVMVQLESGDHHDVVRRIEERFGEGAAKPADWPGVQELFDKMAAICHLVELRTHQPAAPEDIPVNDEAAYALLSSGRMGDLMDALYASHLTQDWFEAEAMRSADLLARLSPKRFSDLMAFVAINRFGPLESGLAEDYVQAACGDAPARYRDERLRPLLEETHGLMLYQEQIMLVSMAVGGFSAGKADKLRRALCKRKLHVARVLWEDWDAGAAKNGYPPEVADSIWRDMVHFARHAYDKSWAATLAALLMRLAYLKTHCPEEWKEVGLA